MHATVHVCNVIITTPNLFVVDRPSSIATQQLKEPSVQWWLLMVHQEPAQIRLQGWILQKFPLNEEDASNRTLGLAKLKWRIWGLRILICCLGSLHTKYHMKRSWPLLATGRFFLKLILLYLPFRYPMICLTQYTCYQWLSSSQHHDFPKPMVKHPFSAITPATRFLCCTCWEHQLKTSPVKQFALFSSSHQFDTELPKTDNRDFADSTCHERFGQYNYINYIHYTNFTCWYGPFQTLGHNMCFFLRIVSYIYIMTLLRVCPLSGNKTPRCNRVGCHLPGIEEIHESWDPFWTKELLYCP